MAEQPPGATFLSKLRVRLPPAWQTPRRWILVGVVAVGLLVLFLLFGPKPSPSPRQVAPGTMVFSVNGRPTLTFLHTIGSVHVVPGGDGQVRIQEVRNGITDAIVTRYTQHGNDITTTADVQTGLYLDTWVDFNVEVPQQSGVQVSVSTGTLTVEGLKGITTLSDTDGSIWVSGLSGSTSLQTRSGSINADQVNGQLVASTSNGTITATRARLSGACTIQAQSGTISFNGTLDHRGHFVFRNNNGAIGVTLAPHTNFQLRAHTTGGSINVGDSSVRTTQRGSGFEANGEIGAAPRPLLMIENGSGSIDLNVGT